MSTADDRYYIGRHKPEVEIKQEAEMHWTEQLRLQVQQPKKINKFISDLEGDHLRVDEQPFEPDER